MPCHPSYFKQTTSSSKVTTTTAAATGNRLTHAPASEEDELWAELERIKDARALREKFYAEHQLMREQLNMAGRFGLDLQQSLEQAQRAEQESYAQLQSLQEENMMLQSRAHHSRELASHLTGSQDEVMNLTNEKDTLQRELDGCRRELKMFRKELDSLVGQMTEMGSEVLDAKAKVSHYSRRLNEVEQELGATQELNVNLQEQLHVAVEKQKQAQSSTAQAVKNMQSELGKVISDKTTILTTLEELENRQDKCEGRVVEMMTNTQEYAHLLEEAQTTIQTLRIESELEGRGWAHQLSVSKRSVGQLSTLASEDPELRQPEFDTHQEEQEENVREEVIMSLGMELGFGNIINNDDEHNVKKQKPVAEPQAEAKQQPQPPLSVSPQPFQSPNSSELQQRLEEHNVLQNVLSTGQSRPPWNPSVSLDNTMPTPTQSRSRSTSRATSQSSSRSVSQVSLRHSPSSTIRNNGGSSINSRTSVMPSPQMSPHSMAATTSSSLMDAISPHSGKRSTVSATSTNNNNKSSSRPRSRTTATTVEKNHVDKNATPGLKFLATKNGATVDPSNVITKTKTATLKATAVKPNRSGAATATSSNSPGAASGRTRATSASVTTTTTTTGTKSGRHLNPVAIDGPSSATQTGRSSPAPPRQRIRSSISNGSLNRQAMSSSPSQPSAPVSPSSSTGTHATQATTTSTAPGTRSISRSNASSPKDSARPSLSPSPSFPSSPLPPSSPSSASKQLKAMAEESSKGIGSRRSSVTSLPLPIPVPTVVAVPSSASSSIIIAATETVAMPVATGDLVA
ncbi:hypothetical protein BG015_009253 [Linnemannia schmuckeri]|uniref:Uncharacterized protein n=1 Tax=Linnemannia schmuckeri TaxID=64567 RepID=A0A9P5S666_9FUNG|nr:hypothetical protein BG015_009253 [Linnemannia schmuckeri]